MNDGRLEVAIATTFGPRVTAFRLTDGPNVFAELGDLSIPLPNGRSYRLAGGHRLWVAPEVPEVTYEPDDSPVTIDAGELNRRIIHAAGTKTGIDKTLSLRLVDGRVEAVHTIVNHSHSSLGVAPWAITQFPVGGTALLPIPAEPADQHGLQPNAEIVLWPYSGIHDTPFHLLDRTLIIHTDRSDAAKIGSTLDRGWLAYLRDGLVFVKRARQVPQAEYLDRGAAAQCYCSPDFVELETLGPVVTLGPGDATTHTEFWELHQMDPDIDPHRVPAELDLDGGEL